VLVDLIYLPLSWYTIVYVKVFITKVVMNIRFLYKVFSYTRLLLVYLCQFQKQL